MVSSQHFVFISTALEVLSGSERYIHVTAKTPWQAQAGAHGATASRTKAFVVPDCGRGWALTVYPTDLFPKKEIHRKKKKKMPGKVVRRKHTDDCNSENVIFCLKIVVPCSMERLHGKAPILISEEASVKTLASHTHPEAGKHNHSAIFSL